MPIELILDTQYQTIYFVRELLTGVHPTCCDETSSVAQARDKVGRGNCNEEPNKYGDIASHCKDASFPGFVCVIANHKCEYCGCSIHWDGQQLCNLGSVAEPIDDGREK